MERFDLIPILKMAIKNIFILLLIGVISASGVFIYCKYFATPRYSSTGSLLVTNGAILTDLSTGERSTLNNTDIVASMNLVETVADILNTNGIYKKLAEKSEYAYTYKDLISRVSIARQSGDSLFIKISFSGSNADESLTLVNEFLELAPAYINEYVPNSEVAISKADSSTKVFPQTFYFMVISAVAGMGITLLILILIYSSNTVIKGEDDFAERFDIEILGNIPDFERSKASKYNSYNYAYHYYGRGGY